jgi:ketosteroid isomerase-like protein
MTEPVARATVEAFYQAYAERDPDKIASFLADDVEWTISGPVEVLPFCGTRHGKAAVLDMVARLIPGVFRIFRFTPDAMLVDGDQAATLVRLSARSCDGRIISYRLSNFVRFRAGKIVQNLSLIDSFDAVEQVLGHPLDLNERERRDFPDLIAV